MRGASSTQDLFGIAESLTHADVREHVDEIIEPLYEEIRKLKWLIHHDVLTGLPNELSLQRRLVEVDGGTFLLVDLDGFKAFQDRLRSHRAGDRVICEFADHLRRIHRDQGQESSQLLISRLHGDEFLLWCATTEAAEEIRTELERWENEEGGVTASVGLGPTLDTADHNMYERKFRKKQEQFQKHCQPDD